MQNGQLPMDSGHTQISLMSHFIFVGTTLTRVLFQQGMSVSSSPVTHTSNTPTKEGQFDESMLEYLVCPLSKTPLR